MEHNYARVLDLQLNAKIKTIESKRTSLDACADQISQASLRNEPMHRIPMMSRTGGFAAGKNNKPSTAAMRSIRSSRGNSEM